MKRKTRHALLIVVTTLCSIMGVMTALAIGSAGETLDSAKVQTSSRPALTVTVTTLQPAMLPIRVRAHGNIMAWQEASIGTEADGLRLAGVNVNVGDLVRRGQVLAVFASDTVAAELAQSRAASAEARATLAEAAANARRARALQDGGALSAQQVQQYVTAERTAQARLNASRAVERVQRLRLAQTRVLAPDDGVISARSATVGAVLPAGEELFRLIRNARLEWRAEVAAAELVKLKPGQLARVTLASGAPVEGTLRQVAPIVDMQTRNGLVFVDLPADGAARAGMFAQGDFELGVARLLTLPQSAVLQRDGFSYVWQVGAASRVIQKRVTVGPRAGERIAISGGIDATAQVVVAGVGFLSDGDQVRVVQEPPAVDPARAASASGSVVVSEASRSAP